MSQPSRERFTCPSSASLRAQRFAIHFGTGVHLPHMWQYLSEGLLHMLQNKKSMSGTVTRPRTAIAMIAATLLLGGTATEASAKSRHHHYRHHHDNQAGNSENNFVS